MTAAESEFLARTPDRTANVTRGRAFPKPQSHKPCLRHYGYLPPSLWISSHLLDLNTLPTTLKPSERFTDTRFNLQTDLCAQRADALRPARRSTHTATTSWSKQNPTIAHQSRQQSPTSLIRNMTHGGSHFQLSSMHIRVTSSFSISSSQQRFASGGRYFCLRYTHA